MACGAGGEESVAETFFFFYTSTWTPLGNFLIVIITCILPRIPAIDFTSLSRFPFFFNSFSIPLRYFNSFSILLCYSTFQFLSSPSLLTLVLTDDGPFQPEIQGTY